YRYGVPQRTQWIESAACWSTGRATCGSSSPKTRPRPSASSATSGSSPLTASAASGRLVIAARREQRGGDPGDEVGAGGVVREPVPRPEHLGRHRGRRRLPVRGGDERGALRQPRCKPVDRVRVELPEQLARDGRAGAGAEQARERAGGPGPGDLGGERKAGPHRRERSEHAPPNE